MWFGTSCGKRRSTSCQEGGGFYGKFLKRSCGTRLVINRGGEEERVSVFWGGGGGQQGVFGEEVISGRQLWKKDGSKPLILGGNPMSRGKGSFGFPTRGKNLRGTRFRAREGEGKST